MKNSRWKVKRSTCTKCWTSYIFVFYLGTYIVDENLSSQHAISYNLSWIYEYTVTVTVVNKFCDTILNKHDKYIFLWSFFLYMSVLWDTRKLSTQSSSIYKTCNGSQKKESQKRMEAESWKSINHSFSPSSRFFSFSGSLLQMRVRTRISNIFKKKSPYFPAYFIRIQIPVPGSGSGSELKKRPLDRDPKKKDGDP